ncbi:MAG TPA: hypothetical protein VIO58_01560 [Candidatus Methanoperedens sp.]
MLQTPPCPSAPASREQKARREVPCGVPAVSVLNTGESESAAVLLFE